MIHPAKLSLIGGAIVGGGLALGLALASVANPIPITPAPRAGSSALGFPIAGGDVQPWVRTMPEDPYPANVTHGYPPAIAFSELRAAADPGFQLHQAAAPLPGEVQERAAPPALDETGQPDDTGPSVPHYAALERAAGDDPSMTAAALGQTGPAGRPDFTIQIDPASPPPLPAGGARMIHIGGAG